MPKIDPPPHPKLDTSKWKVKRAGIWKCVPNSNATCGILWADPDGQCFFEMVHGAVGVTVAANEIVKISRTRCVGTLVKVTKDANLWNMFVERQCRVSASVILKENWDKENL